jgi:anti-anti-sigma factor
MLIGETRTNDSVIIAPKGRIDSETAPGLEKKLRAILAETSSNLILDFSAIDYMSSAGLRIVLLAAKQTRSSGKGLVICGLNDNVREVFSMSGFDKILTIVVSREQAIAKMAEHSDPN